VNASLALLKYGGGLCLTLGCALLAYRLAADPESLLNRHGALYIAYLDRKLRDLLLTPRGRWIALGQLASIAAVLALSTTLGPSLALLALALVAAGPALYLEHLRRARRSAIEAKLDAFALTLSNSLKATPSIGNALAYSEPMLAAPLRDEVALALKEMRVGSTLDQALLNMASRVRSTNLDVALCSVLIGRQVGGNLTQILDTTATTLREMTRLSGVVRAKTAEGKAQTVVLAIFPVAILIMFDGVSPGYFDPLVESAAGWLIVALALGLWLAAIVIARALTRVEI
jgi:tight adherence protein B